MGKIIRRTLTALLIVTSLLTAAIVGAAIQTFDGKGEWHTNDDDNPQMAMNRAEQRAKIDAQKKAGVYLKTFSRSINSELAEDAISAVTNNILEVVGKVNYDKKIIPLSDSQTTILYTATLKARIDTDGIYDWIKRDDKEKVTIIEQNTQLQDAIQKNDTLAENLQEKYNRATSQAEKDRLRKQMTDADRDFLANQKLEEGNNLYYAKDYYGAIKLYTEAIELKPNYADAYFYRGSAYYLFFNEYELALKDYKKAIELNPNYDYAYNNLGYLYWELGGRAYDEGQYERAIQYYNKAIEINLTVYGDRGDAYFGLGQYERAVQDYDKAIQLNPNYNLAYFNRGEAYYYLKNYEKAFIDLNKAIEIGIEIGIKSVVLGEALYYRGMCYEALGIIEKAQADFAKAKELGYNG